MRGGLQQVSALPFVVRLALGGYVASVLLTAVSIPISHGHPPLVLPVLLGAFAVVAGAALAFDVQDSATLYSSWTIRRGRVMLGVDCSDAAFVSPLFMRLLGVLFAALGTGMAVLALRLFS